MQKLGGNFDPNGHFDDNGHFIDSNGRRFDPNRPGGYYDKNGDFVKDDTCNPFTQSQRRN